MNLSNNLPLSSQAKKQPIQNILLVEDSYSQALSLKAVLEVENLTVCVVNDGPEAIEQAQLKSFDLIVLDIELPTLNGFETCYRLRASLATANIPIILFTSHGHPTDVLTGLQLGVTDYIPKDAFAQATLLNTIRYLNNGGSL